MARRPPAGHGERDPADPMVRVSVNHLKAAVASIPMSDASVPSPPAAVEAAAAEALLSAVLGELGGLPTTLEIDESALLALDAARDAAAAGKAGHIEF